MKMVKAILLGTSAAMVSTFASAADLPRKAAPAEYVQVCQGQGAGFFVVPGTTTCLKIGGYVRTDMWYGENTSGSSAAVAGLAITQAPAGIGSSVTNYGTRQRAVVNFDARSQTAMGTLRSFAEFQIQRGGATSSSPDALVGSGNGQYSRSSLASLTNAFVQFAGVTAGFTSNPFGLAGYNGSLTIVANQVSGGYLPAGNSAVQLGYTATFGSGITGTLALVDAAYTRQGALATAALGATVAPNNNDGISYAGNQVPDVVGNINVTQAWGSFQLMGAYHQVKTATVDGTGYAVGAGLRANLPFLAPGSALWVQAAYSKGANVYAFANGGSDGLDVDRNVVGTKTSQSKFADGMINAAGGLELTTVMSLHGGLRTVFTPQIQTGLFGGITKLDAPTGASASGFNNLSDFTLYNVGANITYTPVQNLNLSLEAVYYNMKQTAQGVGAGLLPGALPNNSQSGTYAIGARVQRTF